MLHSIDVINNQVEKHQHFFRKVTINKKSKVKVVKNEVTKRCK